MVPHDHVDTAAMTHSIMANRKKKNDSASKMHKTQQSPGGLGGSFKKSTSKHKLKHTRNKNNMSKDLIAVLSDDGSSAQDSSYQKKQTVEINVAEPSLATNELKRGSAITFFDESENDAENVQKRYEQMNATLDTFERPDQQQKPKAVKTFIKSREVSKSPQPQRYSSKKSLSPQ